MFGLTSLVVPGLDIAKNLLTGSPESDILKKYFDGHWDRYEQRFTNKDFFRWAWYKGWWTDDPQGKSEIPAGMTVADFYYNAFPHEQQDIDAYSRGYYTFLKVSNQASMRFSDDPSDDPRNPFPDPGPVIPADILNGNNTQLLIYGVGALVLLKVLEII